MVVRSYSVEPVAVSVQLAVVLLRGMTVRVRNQLRIAIGIEEGKGETLLKNHLHS
jgi:hypothetical protein